MQISLFQVLYETFSDIWKFWTESANLRLSFSILLNLNTRNTAFFSTRQFFSAILYEVPNKIQFVRELWRPLLQENKTFASRQFPKRQDFRFETVYKKSRNDLETETETETVGSETETETSKNLSRDRDSVSRQSDSELTTGLHL